MVRGRTGLLLACLALAAQVRASSGAVQSPAPVAQQDAVPASAPRSLAQRAAELRASRGERRPAEIALRAGIEFVLTVAEADGRRASEAVDVVGYQVLPLEGWLPENPDPPLTRAALAERVSRLNRVGIGAARGDVVEALDRRAARAEFPAPADWMLPDDVLVAVRPLDEVSRRFVRGPACVIVRVRAGRPSIVAGTLLDALADGHR